MLQPQDVAMESREHAAMGHNHNSPLGISVTEFPQALKITLKALLRALAAGNCVGTRPMISSFSDAGSLMFGLPHPRSCFF